MATVNSRMVLEFLKRNYGTEYTKEEISKALGISLSSVIGSINPLVHKGYIDNRVERIEPTEDNKKPKNIIHHSLNEKGLMYDPNEKN